MKVQDVAKTVMRTSGITQTYLAEKLGKAGPSTISMILSGRSMKVDNLLTILNECGYDLIAKSRDGVRPDYLIGDGELTQQPAKSEVKLRDIVREMVAEELRKQNLDKQENAMRIRFAEDEEQGMELHPDI